MQNNERCGVLIIRFELPTSMYSRGKSSLATVAPVSQELTHVSTGSADCPLISHVRSEYGVEIERTWKATVLSSVTCVNREQRPYVCVFNYILVLLRL